MLKDAFRSFVQLLYPHVCPGCGRHLFKSEKTICRICINELPETNFKPEKNVIADKLRAFTRLSGVLPLYYFNPDARLQTLLHQLKYRKRKDVGVRLGELIGDKLMELKNIHKYRGIVPVPLHKKRLAERGFNQSAMIGLGISKVTSIKLLDEKLLFRTTNTPSQTFKNRQERFENMKAAFEVQSDDVPANIILIDDVITTGATLIGCATTLNKAGAEHILIASVAYTDDLD